MKLKKKSDLDEFMKLLNELREKGTSFKDIKDPVKWQRKQRKEWDRKLDFKLKNIPK